MSTACNIVHEVCKTVVDSLLNKYISTVYITEIVSGFQEKWGVPQCFGAVDGSIFQLYPFMTAPLTITIVKGFHSIVIQALVDHQNRFMNAYVGWLGSVHDARGFL